MSTCGITADLTASDCKQSAIGGVDRIWIIERDNITAFTESSSEITACTLSAGTYAYEIEPIQDTAFPSSNKSEGGKTLYSNQFEFRFSVTTNTDLDAIRGLPGTKKYALVYLLNDGTYRSLGIGDSTRDSRGLRCDVIENSPGATFEDNEGVRVLFTGGDHCGEIFWDNASIDIVTLTDACA